MTMIQMVDDDRNWEEKKKEPAPETQLLVQFLKNMPSGASATYEEMGAVIYKSVKPGGEGYHNLRSAIRIVRDQHGKTFVSEFGVGIKHCVTEAGFLWLADKERKRVMRRCGEAERRIKNAPLEEFDKSARANLVAHMAILRMQRLQSTPKKVKELESAAGEDVNKMTVNKLLNYMRGKNK